MGKAQRIIDLVMGSSRLKDSSAFSDKVYRDEPILITASQMRRFLPQKYRDMRALAARPDMRRAPASLVFAQQARFMADFEDDYPYDGEFSRYYPTYQDMSDEQLRGYFSWRTRLRRGEPCQASTSFLFVRIYELINGVGAASAEEGFAELRFLLERYGCDDDAVRRYLKRWLVDYVAWNGLDTALLDGLVEDGIEDSIARIEGAASMDVASMAFGRDLRGRESSPATPWDELYDAIVALSTYRIESSRLFKEHPHEFRRALCGVCATLARHCAKHRKTSFAQGLFGVFRMQSYEMFANAVFYDDASHADATCRLPDGRVLFCREGRWTLRRRCVPSNGPRLGAIAKAVDACLRDALGVCAPLKHPSLPKYVERIVAEEAKAAVAWEREHAPLELSFDASRIRGIRAAASRTCEALLVDEERDDAGRTDDAKGAVAVVARRTDDAERTDGARRVDGVGRADGAGRVDDANRTSDTARVEGVGCRVGAMAIAPLGADGSAAPLRSDMTDVASVPPSCGRGGDAESCSPLSDAQRAWIAALLAGNWEGAADAVRAAGSTEDLMADAVNEALFDFIGDTAVEASADGYAVVEEYREDVGGLLQ